MNVRPAAVADLFYDADPARLRQQVDALLESAAANPGSCPKALIAPHAAYIYSGSTAACAYRTLIGCSGTIRRVALFGPAHRIHLRGMALPSAAAFETPLGQVRLDPAGLAAVASLPQATTLDEAHRQEHSLEVHLPFLQRTLLDFTLVPVVVGDCPPPSVAAAIDLFWDDPATLVVASTDLSHFLPYPAARARDAATADRIVAGCTDLDGEEACGARVINGLLAGGGAGTRRELLALCNSGDTAGDRDRVVGYAAFRLA